MGRDMEALITLDGDFYKLVWSFSRRIQTLKNPFFSLYWYLWREKGKNTFYLYYTTINYNVSDIDFGDELYHYVRHFVQRLLDEYHFPFQG